MKVLKPLQDRLLTLLFRIENLELHKASLLTLAIIQRTNLLPRFVVVQLRRFFTSLLSSGIVANNLEPEILDVVIPCSNKDNDVLLHCIEGLTANVSHIRKIKIVTPSDNVEALKAAFMGNKGIHVIDENECLSYELQNWLNTNNLGSHYGWVLQQIIKIKSAKDSDLDATLILDADTILLKPRTFTLDKGRQMLIATHELHKPYLRHISKVWPEITNFAPYSFVAHHQLMRRSVLIEMFGEGDRGIVDWVNLADFSSNISALSEYESYGQYLHSTRLKEGVELSKWANTSDSKKILGDLEPAHALKFLKNKFPHNYSVSLHSYNL